MRVALFGGSFDPIHSGHLACARAALDEGWVERIDFVVTARPPHKPERTFAPALARYAMVELALLDEPRLFASSVELVPERPAYTIETLERLRIEAPEHELVLLVGADSLAAFDTWRRWQEILATTEIGVVARPGFGWAELSPRLGAPLAGALRGARLHWLRGVAHPASASEIRRRLAAGEPVPDRWLDPRVLTFATKYSLYR